MQETEQVLAGALARARDAWHAAGELEVPEGQRYAIYAALGPHGDVRADGRRTQLSLLAARRVAPIYAAAVRAVNPPNEPEARYSLLVERILTVTAAAMNGALAYEEAFGFFLSVFGVEDDLGVIADEKDLGDEAWVLTQRADYAWNAALAALDTALRGYRDTGNYRPEKGMVGRAYFRDTYADGAAHAAMAEAWMGEALPPDERRLRAYWRWWLQEAVPLAIEWTPPPPEPLTATG